MWHLLRGCSSLSSKHEVNFDLDFFYMLLLWKTATTYPSCFSPNPRRKQLLHIQNMLLQGRLYWSPMMSLRVTPISHFPRTLAVHHCHHCTHCSQQHLRTPWSTRARNSRSFYSTCCDPQLEWMFAAVHRRLGLIGRLFVPTLEKNLIKC